MPTKSMSTVVTYMQFVGSEQKLGLTDHPGYDHRLKMRAPSVRPATTSDLFFLPLNRKAIIFCFRKHFFGLFFGKVKIKHVQVQSIKRVESLVPPLNQPPPKTPQRQKSRQMLLDDGHGTPPFHAQLVGDFNPWKILVKMGIFPN